MSFAENVIDCSLLIANVYLLLRLGLTTHESFRTPFFNWFLITGVAIDNSAHQFWALMHISGDGLYSSLSVVGYVIGSRFTYPLEHAWVFKVTYILNSFTVTAATIGKIYMSLHRLTVMRSISLQENVWTHSFSTKLVIAQLILSAIQCIQIFFCDYSFYEKNGVKYMSYFDDNCNVFEKSKSSVIYLIFVILSTILIVLTSREMFRMSKLTLDKTKQLLLAKQREMFIVVTVCSVTHLVKAVHQMCWVLVSVFHWQDLNGWLQASYPYTHYLSTYSGAVTLILFNSRVRWLLISMTHAGKVEGTTTRVF